MIQLCISGLVVTTAMIQVWNIIFRYTLLSKKGTEYYIVKRANHDNQNFGSKNATSVTNSLVKIDELSEIYLMVEALSFSVIKISSVIMHIRGACRWTARFSEEIMNKALWRNFNWMLCSSLSSMYFANLLDLLLHMSLDDIKKRKINALFPNFKL